MYFLQTLVIAASLVDPASLVQHAVFAPLERPDSARSFVLAQEYDENGDIQPQRETVRLRLPAAKSEYREGRRCMTVCSEWGEECVVLKSGAQERKTKKCVRACKSFAEECL